MPRNPLIELELELELESRKTAEFEFEFEFEFDSLLLPSVALPSVALPSVGAVGPSVSDSEPSVSLPSVAEAVRPAVMHASSDWLKTAPSSTQVLEQPGA